MSFGKITIVIPTYNEALNLPILCKLLFDQQVNGLHLLIVDDNSPDGCGEVAEDLANQYHGNICVLHRKMKEGLGRAYIQGLDEAINGGADAIGMMDADLSHPPEKLPAMIDALEHADIVIGSRYVKGGSLDDQWPFWRKMLSKFGNYYARSILNIPVKDVTGGFKLWRKNALESIPFRESKSNGYVFQVEQSFLASKAGLRFIEIPIYFAERKFGDSKMDFKIQKEAALKVWQLKQQYKNIKEI